MIELVPYGGPALEALEARIRAAKATDALASVTVLVPNNYAGLGTRRELARRMPLVNVRFQVLARLAELLGGPALTATGRRPLSSWVRQRAIAKVLKDQPGVFAPVVEHPETARELGRVFEELRVTSETALERVAGASERAATVVGLYRHYRRLTGGYYDETDLLEAAASTVAGNTAAAREAGALVLYLPRVVPPQLVTLYRAAAQGAGAHAILGLTGDREVDAEAEAMADRLGGADRREPATAPAAGRLVSATDPEEEAREAIRQAMALARAGTPLHRIAIVYGDNATYGGLIKDALASAEVPHNGPPHRKLADTLPGRTLLGIARMAESGPGNPGYARDVVMDWLTAAPIRYKDREAPSHRWDEISREAGIVRGPEQWRARLERLALNKEAKAGEEESDDAERLRRDAAWARDLRDFFTWLEQEIGRDQAKPAAEHAARAKAWLNAFLPRPALDDEEQADAHERIEHILEEVIALEGELPAGLDLPMTRTQFGRVLEALLDQPFGRTNTLGTGIFVGPVGLAGEMPFDAVFVLGMIEGAFPPGQRDDPLLPAEERARAGGELPPGGKPAHEPRRAFLAALHAAPHRTLSYCRADLRAQRGAHASRWLLESATALAGKRMYSKDLDDLLTRPPAWFRVVTSFESALRDGAEPASAQEWDLGSLLRARGEVKRHFLMAPGGALRRGAEAYSSRARKDKHPLDEWMGRVGPGRAPVPGLARPVSPTALETFAKCPFQYYLKYVLHVDEIENPEEVVTVEPATIGTVVHAVLERFFPATADRPVPDAPWTTDERALLRRIASEEFARAEASGLTGKDLTWRAERARVERDLDLLLDRELEVRASEQLRFRQAEASFGMGEADSRPPASITLADGRAVQFRGKVDRVDTTPTGGLVVTDYKTGRDVRYKDAADKGFGRAQLLQLPVYALAFREESQEAVKARYWFITEDAGFSRKDIILDDPRYEDFGRIVQAFVTTMDRGYFPQVPGEEDTRGEPTGKNCLYCPYDAICPSGGRDETWVAVRDDDELVDFVSVTQAAEQNDG